MNLKYNGDGGGVAGIPARDLDQNDLDRLIEDGLFDSLDHVVETLTARGLYSVVKPKRKKKDDPPDEIVEDNDDGS